MNLQQITPLILTYNEEPNIDRTLSRLTWAKRVVVIDSFSEDRTLEICKNYSNVNVITRKFDSHTHQWNYGLNQVSSEWVLSMDADYIITDDLLEEIQSISWDAVVNGFFIPFKYCVFGKPLRQNMLPPRLMLFKIEKGIYIDDGHTQLLKINGDSDFLKCFVYHDDRKPLSRWLWAQDRYMILETKKILNTPIEELSFGDRIRKQIILAPFIILFYCLFLKQGIFDGWRGWYYAFQRMFAEILLSLRLIEARFFQD